MDPSEEELLFALALKRRPGEREEFLRSACENKDLRIRLEELIAAYESGDSVLDSPYSQSDAIRAILQRLGDGKDCSG